MKYVLKPSLLHIALVKIAATLWNQKDVRALMREFKFVRGNTSEKIEEWQKIENRVVEKVQQLPQPGFLKKKIMSCIKPIGLQIFKWMECHCTSSYLCIDLPTEFCWTSQGTIDRKKTAKMLIKDASVDITTCYNLARIYCLGNIPELWIKRTENCKKPCTKNSKSHQDAVYLWKCDMNQEILSYCSMNVDTLSDWDVSRFSEFCNKAAVKRFLGKLSPSQRKTFLVNLTKYILLCVSHYIYRPPKEDYSDILCFLLSQMDEEQENEVFKDCEFQALSFLLEWPWQSFFMEALNRTWNFLIGNSYLLLYKIIDKIKDGHKDFDYKKLFYEVWQKIPTANQRQIQHPCGLTLLLKVFEMRDREIFQLIFQSLTLTEKQNHLLSPNGINVCTYLIFHDNFGSIEVYIEECEPSKDVLIKFKDNIKKHISNYSKKFYKKYKDKFKKFFQLLDGYIIEKGKV